MLDLIAGSSIQLTTAKGSVMASVIKVWERGRCDWIMSTSSGPKDCLVNSAMHVFESFASSDRVAYLLTARTVLFLIRVDGEWQDILGERPMIQIQAFERRA